jgi:alkylation response protein AidB-like acyl-CoA dehydrogenase
VIASFHALEMQMSDVTDALARVIDTVVAPRAADVDRDGSFPAPSVSALGEIGVHGLVSASSVGGGGQGLDVATQVIE